MPYLRVIRSPCYFPLWLGQIVSNLGDTLNYVAVVVLVFRLNLSGLAVSALVGAEIVPVLLLGPVAGVVIARFDRQRVLLATNLLRGALVVALVFTHAVWGVYAIAALLAAGSTLFTPALQAVIPVLLSEEERLAANSAAWSSGRLVQIVGASVAGGLIAWAGTTPAFLANAASFAFSTAMITLLTSGQQGITNEYVRMVRERIQQTERTLNTSGGN